MSVYSSGLPNNDSLAHAKAKPADLPSSSCTKRFASVFSLPFTLMKGAYRVLTQGLVAPCNREVDIGIVRADYEHLKQSINGMNTEDPSTEVYLKDFILEARSNRPRLTVSLKEEIEMLKNFARTDGNVDMTALLEGIDFSPGKSLSRYAGPHSTLAGTMSLIPSPRACDRATSGDSLRHRRSLLLKNLPSAYAESRKDPRNQVVHKYFPPTHSWFVGSVSEASPLELEMAQVGNENGIAVISYHQSVDTHRDQESLPEKMIFLDCTMLGRKAVGVFPQDYIDFTQNGEIRIPFMKTAEGNEDFFSAVEQGRLKRTQYDWGHSENGEPLIPVLGQPFDRRLSRTAIAFASSIHAPLSMNLTYNEGGNALIGERNSKPYVLIGKDSYSASKYLMEKELGRKMKDDEVRMAFAIDYGVAKEEVYFIEQPGDFHLDTCMALVGDNTILLNDSELAQQMFETNQEQWLEAIEQNTGMDKLVQDRFKQDMEEEREAVKTRKQLEDLTEKDLKKAGFKVIRVAGRFNYSAKYPVMNLFNMVTAKTPENRNIVVMTGCLDKSYEDAFKEIIATHCQTKIDQFYFMSFANSSLSLASGGGIACRTKTLPPSL